MSTRTWGTCCVALAVLSGCAGDKPVNPLAPDAANHPPAISAMTIMPTTIPSGGIATVVVVASDPDGDALTYSYACQYGKVTAGSTPGQAVYQNDGSTLLPDTIAATVTDGRGASRAATASVAVRIQGGPAPTPTPEITPVPTPEPTATPGGTPRPPTTPTPTPTPNQAPTASVAASAPGCHPTKTSASATPKACTVTCTATATDPDGDALSYAWSGCASGTASTATCSVADINVPHDCSVNVSDGHGHTVSASATVTGTNTAPQQTGWVWMLDGGMHTGGDLPANHPADGNLFFLFTPTDDDSRETMTCVKHMQIGGCTLGSCETTSWDLEALKIVISTGAAGDVCKFDLTVIDPWGGTSSADTQRFGVN